MPATTVDSAQIRDGTVSRSDLNTTGVGQSVVAKIIQGANVTLTSTGADSGTGDVTISTASGGTGPPGANAFTTLTAGFTVPPIGSTVTANLVDASWIVVGESLWVDQAAGGPGQGGLMQVTAKTGNQVTLLNLTVPAIPLADNTQNGLLKQLSGNTTDFVDGTNNCRNLVNATFPTGTVLDYAGATAPTLFLLCDGTAYSRTTYAALYAILGGASSPWGQGDGSTTFNVPDLRGRAVIGAGQGTGLTNRTLGATGGEEVHQLVIAELASHYHYCSGVGHTHGMDHYHVHDHYHQVDFSQINHAHGLSDPGHTHMDKNSSVSLGASPAAVAGATNVATGSSGTGCGVGTAGFGVGNSGWTSTIGYQNTNYASQTNAAWANTGGASATAFNSNNTGSDTAHNTMMPFAVLNKIIKT